MVETKLHDKINLLTNITELLDKNFTTAKYKKVKLIVDEVNEIGNMKLLGEWLNDAFETVYIEDEASVALFKASVMEKILMIKSNLRTRIRAGILKNPDVHNKKLMNDLLKASYIVSAIFEEYVEKSGVNRGTWPID